MDILTKTFLQSHFVSHYYVAKDDSKQCVLKCIRLLRGRLLKMRLQTNKSHIKCNIADILIAASWKREERTKNRCNQIFFPFYKNFLTHDFSSYKWHNQIIFMSFLIIYQLMHIWIENAFRVNCDKFFAKLHNKKFLRIIYFTIRNRIWKLKVSKALYFPWHRTDFKCINQLVLYWHRNFRHFGDKFMSFLLFLLQSFS